MPNQSLKDANGTESSKVEAARSRFEKFEIVEIDRKDLKGAPYNPRRISDKARKRLKENLDKVGLLQPVVWNVRTGNIVSGHQRLLALDTLQKNHKYRLRVARVDLDEKTEKEQNIFMNNSEAQGDWDLDKLGELIKIDRINIDSAGFDQGQIYQLFGDTPLIEQPEQLIALSDKLRQAQKTYEEIRTKTRNRDDQDFYLVVVFRDTETRKTVLDALHLPDNRFVDGRDLLNLLPAK